MLHHTSTRLALLVSAAAALSACGGHFGHGGYGGYGGRDAAAESIEYNRAAREQREHLAERVRQAFRADPRLGTSVVVESPADGVIRLSGAPVGGMNFAQLAVDTARRVPGVREIENRLASF